MNDNKVHLPKKGTSRTTILEGLQTSHDSDTNWHDGRTFSLVYHASDEHTEFLKKAYSIYFHQNGLNPSAFPSLKRFEAEVVSISANLLGGGESAAGTMTSGGTESILMAIKTYRDWARVVKPEIMKPEMIVPSSIHPAFDKAAHYFDVKLIKAPLRKDFRVDLSAVEKLITANTILLVGSAPQYPHGVIDPIPELAGMAKSRGIGMHVDACVGGFILPFLKMLGYPIPPFDLSVDGVTSMSADLHKYGFASKGASIVLYKDKELRRHQFFVLSEWAGGAFASPSMPGTRPAGAIAAAWATLQAFGEDGYLEIAKTCMENTKRLQEGVKALGYSIVGQPEMSIFGFQAESLDVYAVADQMQLKGWYIDRQQKPTCLHLMVTPAHTQQIDVFLQDLKEATERVRTHPELSTEGMAAMYGMMAKVPDASMVNPFLYQYMDERYSTSERSP
ncbi:MAG: aspartate aminotransferase family protein [Cryobacterium sp.]|nr:aspartate aminotransferase family protein [Oligoflexia bacterium]